LRKRQRFSATRPRIANAIRSYGRSAQDDNPGPAHREGATAGRAAPFDRTGRPAVSPYRQPVRLGTADATLAERSVSQGEGQSVWREIGLPSPVAERGEVLVVWKGCKPDSVVDSHLSMRPVPAAPALNCFRALMRATSRRLFGLAPDGVFRAADIATDAVGSYPAVSPLPRKQVSGRSNFCGTIRQPDVTSGCPRLRGASRPEESGLSSPSPFRTCGATVTERDILRKGWERLSALPKWKTNGSPFGCAQSRHRPPLQFPSQITGRRRLIADCRPPMASLPPLFHLPI